MCASLLAQSNVNVRIMAANLNGNSQTYEAFGLRIFQALKPDVVAIQEFNFSNNTAGDFRSMVDTAFGTNFVYFRENYSGIPNGIISRWPILASGSWGDPEQNFPNRGFAWAQIQLPGTNTLYLVSVHLLTSGNRTAEAVALKSQMQSNFPANAWIVVAGDFNASSRTEGSISTFNGYLTDTPIPVDKNTNSFTSMNRNSPHDFVLPSLTLTNYQTATVYGPLTYNTGLVFDSRVYTANELTNFPPVQSADSGLGQHMGVIKDFSIPVGPATNPPVIVTQPAGKTNGVGGNISLAVTATGSGTLNYQWRFNTANISGATTNPFVLADPQLTNSGNYTVVITNAFGSVTSSIAVVLLTNAPPAVVSQPPSQTILAGQNATFPVSVTGTSPLAYQWRFNGAAISGATTNPLVLAGAQSADAGNYTVVITNSIGSVTSAVAVLSVIVTNPTVFTLWNFNSVVADTNLATGSTLPAIGSGTASTVGGIAASFVTGDTTLDPAGTNDNTAWTTTTYPAASTGNKTAGVQFAVSTAGKQNISFSWSQRSSNTGGKYFRLQYSTNSGAGYTDFPEAVTVGTSFSAFTNDLSALPGVNNNSNVVFRIVAEFQSTATGSGTAAYAAANTGSTYSGSGGTTRFDMVGVSGVSYVNATPALLTSVVFTNNQFSFTVNGTLGGDYIVQSTTNLTTPNWTALTTNVSPFNYTEANFSGPQKFYRAVAQ